MKPRLSFQGLILVGCLLVVLTTLAITAWFLHDFTRQMLMEQARSSVRRSLLAARELVEDRWRPDQDKAQSDALADQLGRLLGMRLTLIDRSGRVLGDSQVDTADLVKLDNHATRPEVIAALAGELSSSVRFSDTLDLDLMYAAATLERGGRVSLVVRLALPLSEVDRTLARLRTLILGACLIGALFSLLAAYAVARRLSTPVRQLKEVATAISGGDLSRRFLRYTSSDIGALGRAFDNMADRLQEKIGDITEARDRLQAMLGGMVEGVLVCDRDGRIILANRALSGLLELSDPPEGRTVAQAVRNSELREAIKAVLAGQDQVTLQINTLGQTARTLEVHVASLRGEAQRRGAVAVFHDVTERERLDRMRRDFVANLSHELRTPLTTMRGALETLLDGALDDPHYSRHFAESTLRQVERLARLVDDLLDLSRLESGQIKLEVEEFPAADLAHAALETVSELAWSRKVELSLALGREPVMIRGDQGQLEQALINLLHNAIAYNQEGGSVSLSIEQGQGEVRIQVSDSGVGIAPEHLPRLFERFYRVDKNRSRAEGGTGLGLAIVKHIVQAHGGRVAVESRPGRGSTFTISIPS